NMRYPLVEGQGNFGSIDGDNPAAMRYTEVRLTELAEELLADIDKATVPFVDNFDGRHQQPVVLPARLPNLLLNGSDGIAVGMATKIPPHNLGELIDAITVLIENPDASVEEFVAVMPGPDFPGGGLIIGREGIEHAYATGTGKITLRATTSIESDQRGREALIVTERIRSSRNREAASDGLVAALDLTPIQARPIRDMPLGRLAALERQKILDELRAVEALVRELESILASRTKLMNILKKELRELKEKYGDERRTRILDAGARDVPTHIEDLVPNGQTVVALTLGGYLKRLDDTGGRNAGR